MTLATTEPEILPLGTRDSSVETWRSTVVSTVKVSTPASAAPQSPAAQNPAVEAAPLKQTAQDKEPLKSSEVNRGPSKDQIKPDEVVQGLGLKLDFSFIPDILEFKIGEVADLLGIKAYVLRFWETEFDALQPEKAKNNQRVYSRKDVKVALLIKHLLYKEKYSIEGARAALDKAKGRARKQAKVQATLEGAHQVRENLQEILMQLRSLRDLF